ncbi:MAG: M23 family metallopeptidase [Fusobacteria bacterium]|nr:M23 family metallopeptidase [Fusobacteriota bacterium]
MSRKPSLCVLIIILIIFGGCSSTKLQQNSSATQAPLVLETTYTPIKTKAASSYFNGKKNAKDNSSTLYSSSSDFDNDQSYTQSSVFQTSNSINDKITTIYENEILKMAHVKNLPSSANANNTQNNYEISSTVPAQFYAPVSGVSYVKEGNTLVYSVANSTQVLPASKGLVIYAGTYPSYGNTLFVYGDNNYVAVYYNLTTLYVKKGDYVTNLSVPVAVASSSFDFEIRKINGTSTTSVDPTSLLKTRS